MCLLRHCFVGGCGPILHPSFYIHVLPQHNAPPPQIPDLLDFPPPLMVTAYLLASDLYGSWNRRSGNTVYISWERASSHYWDPLICKIPQDCFMHSFHHSAEAHTLFASSNLCHSLPLSACPSPPPNPFLHSTINLYIGRILNG